EVESATAPLPTVTISAAPGASEAGPTSRAFTITRQGPIDQPLVVNFSISGTATNGFDYASIPTSMTILAGLSSAVVLINPVDDSLIEGTESVIMTLAQDRGYYIGAQSAATMQIADNDD